MTTASVTIHSSQFPESVRRDLMASLKRRQINHKFHYDSLKQTNQWLALHEAHSPARTDRNVLDIYDRAFVAVAKGIFAGRIHVTGLGCGGGHKDSRLLELLKKAGKQISYTPSDVSVAMTLVARKTALKVVPPEKCFPLVCDLATADDLPSVLTTRQPTIITFFGMIPNFEPADILPKLVALMRKQDYLLFSANLAPGKDYDQGMKIILPQYDNGLTREWLLTFLLNLGIERTDGKIVFGIEEAAKQLRRVVAGFHFSRMREIVVHDQKFKFQRCDSIRLFFSYRYTPDHVNRQLARHGLNVQARWLAESGEEGVFLCRRA